MPRYTILPESFMAPNPFSPFLRVSFRLPYESRDPIYPATGLQLSFERGRQEIFAGRITADGVQHTESGLCTVLLARDDAPKYRAVRREASSSQEADDEEVLVRLHAWKGDRHLGAWEVGTLRGADAALVVV